MKEISLLKWLMIVILLAGCGLSEPAYPYMLTISGAAGQPSSCTSRNKGRAAISWCCRWVVYGGWGMAVLRLARPTRTFILDWKGPRL